MTSSQSRPQQSHEERADELAMKWVLEGSQEAQTEQLLALIHDESVGELARYELYLHELRKKRGRDRRIAFGALVAAYIGAVATFLALALLAATMEGTTSQIVVAVVGAASAAVAGSVFVFFVRRIVDRRREMRAKAVAAATAWKESGLSYREAH